MDKFELFFKENRLRLDTEDLDNAFSEKIFRSLPHRKIRIWQAYAVISTAAVILLGIFLLLKPEREYPGRQQAGIFPVLATDLVREENSYLTSINHTTQAIREMEVPAAYEPMFTGFVYQLKLIDNQYAVYKKQVEQHGYSQEIVQQIIYNYQLKLSVLQMLQSEIIKINHLAKNEKNEYKKIQFPL